MRLKIFAVSVFVLSLVLLTAWIALEPTPAAAAPGTPTSGSLQILGNFGGFCPLRHTDVQAGVSGLVARVVVTQSFGNPSPRAIEAVYTFPLPHDAAVDDMTIRIGDRTIRGVIKTREDAAKIYEKAMKMGHTAALLDQERPNIFTQSIGNIPPGANIDVVISYVQMLKYEDGAYEFSFPMVVGPRYIPGSQAISQKGGGFSPDSDQVPDASKITPPIAPTRAGHDISLAVALDAGIAVQDLDSPTHEVDISKTGATSAIVKLRDDATIPNKDFVLRYNVAGSEIVEGLLTHTRGASDGYFSLIIQPPARFPESDVTPKEIVFVLDSSGSMNGFPETKAKEFIDNALNGLYAGDTFNVIKFSGETAILFKQPVYPSAMNVAKAREFVNAQWGGGGTEMMNAIKAALDPSDSQDHLRIVVFLTDGYVGNDFEILSEIQKHPNARVFAFGIGSSVNSFLINGMGQVGRGESETISERVNAEEADAAAKRLYEHLRSPLLTDVSLDFGSLPVTDVYPAKIPDLFAGKPIVVTGRYTGTAKGTVHLAGKRAGDVYTRDIPVVLPVTDSNNSVLPNVWARNKIEGLMSQDLSGAQQAQMKPALQKEITQIGLSYGLMTQFTSFVAVEETVSNVNGRPQTIQVPVELPESVQMEQGWAGGMAGKADRFQSYASVSVGTVSQMAIVNGSSGVVAGVPGGVGSGIVGGRVLTKNGPPAAVPRTATSSPSPLPPPPPGASGSGAGGGGSRLALPSEADESKQFGIALKDAALASKLHPVVFADYDCWQKLADKSAAASCHVRGGKLAIEIVTSGSVSTADLANAGFEPDAVQPVHNHLRGRIAIERLPALAALKEVQFVAPAK